MKVSAAPGTRCPKEGKPREYINDNTYEEMPDTAYYRRLVSDGSLIIQDKDTLAVIPAEAGIQDTKKKGGNK